jgi:P pilus assembly chaperone PapD
VSQSVRAAVAAAVKVGRVEIIAVARHRRETFILRNSEYITG